MKKNLILIFVLFIPLILVLIGFGYKQDDQFITYEADPKAVDIKLFWKDNKGNILKSLGAVKSYCDQNKEKLLFAMNGGMYTTENKPLGLYIENGKIISPINNKSASGNFYLKPNGIFCLTESDSAFICKTENFQHSKKIKYATQSGPMLLVNGNIHPVFTKGSANVNIRNGVGILPGNKILFVMSKAPVNFYDFAVFFKSKGCKNAVYLDGFVSRTYLPGKNWIQTDGKFAIIIGAISKK